MTKSAACKHCGTTFQPYRPQNIYCSDPCRYAAKSQSDRDRPRRRRKPRASAPVVTHNEQRPARVSRMTDAEFDALYAQIQREIRERGGLLFDPTWRMRSITGVKVSD